MGKADRLNNDLENLLCPKCKKPLSTHKCNNIPPGEYEGDGGELGDEIVKVYYDNDFSTHPFFIELEEGVIVKTENPRNGIEAHHLLSSSSVRYDDRYKALIRMTGYSINHRKNGVLIPTFMQTACLFGVPLHNGGHKATFILNKKIDDKKELESIKSWKFKTPKSHDMKAVFSGYDELTEIEELNYEDHVNEIVMKICKKYIKMDICDEDERLNIAKEFIKEMDKSSQIIFKRLSTFQWILVSDGYDYAPGGIGCCECETLKSKRVRIKESLKNKVPTANSKVKKFWLKILSSPEIVKEINQQNYICRAGINDKSFHLSKKSGAYYKERKNIKDFEKFKDPK